MAVKYKILCRSALIAVSVYLVSIVGALASEKTAETLVDQSKVLIRERKFGKAERLLGRAVRLDPNIAEAHHNLGLIYARIGKGEDAYAQFESAVRLNPQLSQSWLMLASMQQASGNLKSAISSYDQFLMKFPKSKLFDKIKNLRDGLQIEQEKLSNTGISDQSQWRHSQMPLRVFVGTMPKEVEMSDGNPRSFDVDLRRAFRQWQLASDGLVEFTFVTDPQIADIECRFVQETNEFENSAEAGQCEFYLNDQKERRCLIKFQIAPVGGGSLRPDLDVSGFKRTALHEIGHALGLVGHTPNPKDIMFCSTQVSGNMKLSDADIERLRHLYKDKQKP